MVLSAQIKTEEGSVAAASLPPASGTVSSQFPI